jgi:amino acid transporter
MSDTASSPPALATDLPTLRRGALDLRHAIVISVAVMSPAASIFFNTIPQAGLVGAAIPLCYLIGFIVALLMANQYSEMSRVLPSSGSAYTFVVEGLGPHLGFLVGWIGLIAIALGVPYSFILMSANLQTLVARWFGLDLHWSFWFVLAIGIVFAISYIGIRQSLSIDMTFLTFEIGVCLVLAVIVLFHVGGQGNLTAEPFTLDPVPANGNLTAGIILGVLSFIGFETAATLGEETRNPHRNIPRAVFGSMLVVGVFYLVMAYAATVGYGVNNMATGATSYAQNAAPFDTISRQVSGEPLAVLIDLAGIFSFFGAALAIINGGARIIYTVGRDGLFPRWTTRLHPKRQTPINAIAALCGFGLVSGIALGLALEPINAFGFLGVLDALFVMLIYLLVNIACVRYFLRKRRESFRLVRHGIFPVLSTLLIGSIFLAVFVSPGDAPLSYAPLVLGAWLVLGVIILLAQRGKIAETAPVPAGQTPGSEA